jgi:hypothetical protein
MAGKNRFHGEAEHGGVDSNAQREADDGHSGECRISAEGTQRIMQILPQVFQPAGAARNAAFLFHLLWTAEGDAALSFGFRCIVTLGDQVARVLVEVKLNFLVELFVQLLSAQQALPEFIAHVLRPAQE